MSSFLSRKSAFAHLFKFYKLYTNRAKVLYHLLNTFHNLILLFLKFEDKFLLLYFSDKLLFGGKIGEIFRLE